MYHPLYFPPGTFTLLFPCLLFFFLYRTRKQVLSIKRFILVFIKGQSISYTFGNIRKQSSRGVLVKKGVRPATLLKKRLWHRFFFCECCEISKNSIFHRTPRVAASEHKIQYISRLLSTQ